jgi:hypothetical protein
MFPRISAAESEDRSEKFLCGWDSELSCYIGSNVRDDLEKEFSSFSWGKFLFSSSSEWRIRFGGAPSETLFSAKRPHHAMDALRTIPRGAHLPWGEYHPGSERTPAYRFSFSV